MHYATLTTLVSVLAFTHFASAAPRPVGAKSILEGAPIKWTGKIFAERDEYTLHCDIESIAKQIRAINPNYKREDFPHELTRPARLSKRNKTIGSCGNFANGESADMLSMMSYLSSIGGTCEVNAGPDVCSRLTCQNTSAIYLCNDNTDSIAPSCSYLETYASDIYYSCSGGELLASTPISGQEYDSDGYNVVLAYGNCGDSTLVRPDQYTSPSPNGEAASICTDCINP